MTTTPESSSSHLSRDDCWAENVGPLLDALESCGIDPVAWAELGDNDLDLISDYMEKKGINDTLLFAMGYLQATGNLTNATWAEQIRGYYLSLPEEERPASLSA